MYEAYMKGNHAMITETNLDGGACVRISVWFMLLTLGCGFAQPDENDERGLLPLGAAPAPGVVEHKEYWSQPISWRGRQYTPSQAIPVLVNAILDDQRDAAVHADAIKELDRLATQLAGTGWIPELVTRYVTLDDPEAKAELLRCLSGSEDPRALPLFYAVLVNEEEPIRRLRAATGLAKWNIRRGVQALIELFPSTAKTSWIDVGVLARRGFSLLNKRKGWQCPVHDIDTRALATKEQAGHEAGAKALMAGFREWFDANKHRFPDWKPGDPLPEVSAPDKDKSGEE